MSATGPALAPSPPLHNPHQQSRASLPFVLDFITLTTLRTLGRTRRTSSACREGDTHTHTSPNRLTQHARVRRQQAQLSSRPHPPLMRPYPRSVPCHSRTRTPVPSESFATEHLPSSIRLRHQTVRATAVRARPYQSSVTRPPVLRPPVLRPPAILSAALVAHCECVVAETQPESVLSASRSAPTHRTQIDSPTASSQ